MTRRGFLRAAAAAVPASLNARAKTRPPNIVVILADDLGAGDLSCYGASDLATPAVDSLAKDGMRFTQFYANSPVCSPTRAALLTGRDPDLVGVPGVIRTDPNNSFGALSRSAVLLPSVLRARGYHTCAIGKWHLGLTAPDHPMARGFHQFRGFLGDMMDDYFTHRRHGNNYMRDGRREVDPQGHATDLFTDWAVDYVESRRSARDPFFLYLGYNAPHTPIQPVPQWFEKVRTRQPGLPDKRARIAALIEHMDSGVGRVMDALRDGGHMDNTLVIFTSDNGGELDAGGTNGRLRSGKGTMYEGGIRVPAIARWPGRIAPGSTSGAVLQTSDIFPTLCEAAGANPPSEVTAQSFLGVARGAMPGLPDRTLFWVRREGGPRYSGGAFYAIRRGPWKLLQNTPFSPLELFHLESDPQETRDVAGEQEKVRNELAQELQQHIIASGRIPWTL